MDRRGEGRKKGEGQGRKELGDRGDRREGTGGRSDSAHGFQVLHQVSVESRGFGSPEAKEPSGDRQHGQLVQVVINSGKGARSQARSGHEP